MAINGFAVKPVLSKIKTKNKIHQKEVAAVTKMKSTTTAILVLIFALIVLIVYGSLKNTGDSVDEFGNSFEGSITNINVEPGIYDGTGAYDRTCKPIENGMTQCDGGIQTEKGLLNFQYKHDMMQQGCIDAGQNFKVEVFADNKAKVTRL